MMAEFGTSACNRTPPSGRQPRPQNPSATFFRRDQEMAGCSEGRLASVQGDQGATAMGWKKFAQSVEQEKVVPDLKTNIAAVVGPNVQEEILRKSIGRSCLMRATRRIAVRQQCRRSNIGK
jgi:hypothetical protein